MPSRCCAIAAIMPLFNEKTDMTPTDIHETIKDIKSKFRLYMNGKVSQSMRDKGMTYKLNFGIEYPRIKEIAAGYEASHDLAQSLWKENIRECKIMAGLLQPIDTFYPEIADIWVESMEFPEIAEYTVMNLFRRLPYASEAAFRWMADDREYFQFCGFLLMTHLLMKGQALNERADAEFLDQALAALDSEFPTVERSAISALMKYADRSEQNLKTVRKELKSLVASGKNKYQSLLDGLD